jgi:acetyltransferase-like isoleucine patch superfamily enzyme
MTILGPLTFPTASSIANTKLGKGSFINTEVRFAAPYAKIVIGQRCHIGPRVCFETVNHTIDSVTNKRNYYSKDIIIKDDVWIGCGAILTPGIIVGEGATIAAGAVVCSNVAAGDVIGGVPGKILKTKGT